MKNKNGSESACLAAQLPLPLDGRLGLEDLAELLGDGEANLSVQ